MVKVSPVARFPGSIELPDYLTLPQVAEIEQVLTAEQVGKTRGEVDLKTLPLILSIVTKWQLTGFPETLTLDTFPGSPRIASAHLIAWALNCIMEIYRGEIEIPNG